MRPCSYEDRHIKVWLSLEIKQNHWGILKIELNFVPI